MAGATRKLDRKTHRILVQILQNRTYRKGSKFLRKLRKIFFSRTATEEWKCKSEERCFLYEKEMDEEVGKNGVGSGWRERAVVLLVVSGERAAVVSCLRTRNEEGYSVSRAKSFSLHHE